MKTHNPDKSQQIEAKNFVIGAVSIFVAVSAFSLLAISLGIAQMA